MNYDFLPVSNGSGDAALMHVTATRLTGATTIAVDSVANVPTKFIGTYGTLGADGFITAASKRDFRGHTSGADLIIDAFEPGSVDAGNTIGQIVIIKPTTGWANRVANFIKNMTGLGTPEDITVDALTATSITVGGKDIAQLTPSGIVVPFAGAAAPASWLLCDGAAISRATYADLFAILATTYGVGDGATTFNLPNLKGRTIHGVDVAQAEFAARNTAGGSKVLQAHTHGVNDPGHGHGVNDPGHAHSINREFGSNDALVPPGQFQQLSTTPNGGGSTNGSGTGISIAGNGTGVSIQSAGSGANNMAPYLTLNYIIKT